MSRIASAFALILAGLALAACTAPLLDSPPGEAPPEFPGVSVTSPDHSVGLRNLLLPDPGPNGYPAGSPAPLTMQVWNNTNNALALIGATVKGGRPAVLVAGSTSPATAFEVRVSAGANVLLNQQSGQFLQITCTSGPIVSGAVVPMTFTFSNRATIDVDVPVGRYAGPSETAKATCT